MPGRIDERDAGFTGERGRIDWQYFTAADVCAFTVTRQRNGAWSMAGTVVNENAYKLAQQPLVFVVPTKFGMWRWRVEAHVIAEHTIRARLGPVEKVHSNGSIAVRRPVNHAAYARRW